MSHPVAVRAARLFAASGFPVFRFDFSGCGDSEGDLRFVTVEDWLIDLDAAIKFFRKETGVSQCLLWGLRLGAGLALIRQQSDRDIAGLILWQPVLDFSLHIKQFLRRAISSQISNGRKGDVGSNIERDLLRNGLVHVIGYPVSKKLYVGFNKIGNQLANTYPVVPTLILSISSMEQAALDLRGYAERSKGECPSVMLLHVVAEPFWDRYWRWECNKVIEATLQWLRSI